MIEANSDNYTPYALKLSNGFNLIGKSENGGTGNHAPTDITLSNWMQVVGENSPYGGWVGTFYAVDPDAGERFTYTLLDDADGYFQINMGSTLVVGRRLDYETAASHNITVRATDAHGAFYDKTFTITVRDEPEKGPDWGWGWGNHVPTDIILSNDHIAEDWDEEKVIGTLQAIDPDGDKFLSYTIINRDGTPFRLEHDGNGGAKLMVAKHALLDYETAPEYTITVMASDSYGMGFFKNFTIHLTDVVEAGAEGKGVYGSSYDHVLVGGHGRHVVTGGKGHDMFVFATKPVKKANVDLITDFNVKDDTIELDHAVFAKAGKAGFLKKDAFFVGSKAHDASDRIVYDKKTGAVFYDDDGTGKHAAVQIVQLSENLKVTEKDFFLV